MEQQNNQSEVQSQVETKVNTEKSKKRLIIVAIIAILIAILVGVGIWAYLTDTEEATNKFTIGKVDIELDEGGWNPVNGNYVTANAEIVKEPKIKNVGKNEAFVYLKVKVPKVKLNADDTEKVPLFTYKTNSGWTELKSREEEDYIEKVYYYNEKLAKNSETPTLFDKVKVANTTSETTFKTKNKYICICNTNR